MRKKIILFKLFSFIICCFCLSVLKAQDRSVMGSSAKDSLEGTKDSVSKDVRLLFSRTLPFNLTAVSTDVVYNKDLIKSPVTNVLNALTGRLSGLFTQQSSGLPGSDGVSVSLRGQSPLIFVDGVARALTTIDLEEVESVTVLKDALGTAMMGVRGSQGALLITTKKGSTGKQQISFTAQTAFQKPLDMPQALNSFQYATLRNEAVANETLAGNNFSNLLFSPADLQAYQDGSDPTGHPNVDWRSEVLRPSARFDRFTLSATGGSTTARYYVALENFNQTGLLKTSDVNKYNTNNGLNSYLIRSNVDLNINKKLSAGIYLFGRLMNVNEPGSTINTLFNSFLTTPSTAYPLLNANGSFAGVQQYQNNIQAQAIASGYQQSYRRDILADFYLKRSFDEVTPGLWAKAKATYSSNLIENINRSKPVIAFQQTAPNVYTQYGVNSDQLNSNSISNQGRQSYFELSLGYNRTFNATHGFDVLLLANTDNSVANGDLPYTIKGTSGRVSYNYKERYIAEAAFGLNGSNRYPDNGKFKYGFFPAVGLGWNIAKESFMESNSWVSYLKLSGSYGRTGNDNPGYFSYIQRINNGASSFFGSSAGALTTLVESTLANPNITFEKANKLNVGLSGSLFKNKLNFSAEYYDMKYADVLMQRGKNTSLLGNAYPNENIGRNKYNGWDFQLGWQQSNNKLVNYFISANAGIQNSKVLYMDEVNQPFPWMARTGQRVGRAFGYVADGLFQSQAEITGKATFLGYAPQPGDIRYKDLNSDGFINQLDQAPVGSDKPNLFYGIALGVTVKGFDLSALVQGVANRNVYLNGNGYWEFQNSGFGNAYEQHLDRWTPSNPNASYPRLSIGNNPNNQVFSSYWFRKADYLRLKNIEVGYTLTGKYAQAVKLQSIRIFANGTNLLTSTSLKDMDPEVNLGAYPIQRLFNIGVNVKL